MWPNRKSNQILSMVEPIALPTHILGASFLTLFTLDLKYRKFEKSGGVTVWYGLGDDANSILFIVRWHETCYNRYSDIRVKYRFHLKIYTERLR